MLIPKGPSLITSSYHCEVNCYVTEMKSGLKGYHFWGVLLLLHPGALWMKSTHNGGGLPWFFKTPPSIIGGSASKESTCIAGDPGSIPGWGRSPGEGNGNPLQYYCLENPIDRVGHDLATSLHFLSEGTLKSISFLYSTQWLPALTSVNFCAVQVFSGLPQWLRQ